MDVFLDRSAWFGIHMERLKSSEGVVVLQYRSKMSVKSSHLSNKYCEGLGTGFATIHVTLVAPYIR